MIKWFFLLSLSFLIVLGFVTLSFGTIVLNQSNSLVHNAYLFFPNIGYVPKFGYVLFQPPHDIRHKFNGISFVKQVLGTSGDQLISSQNCVELNDYCHPLDLNFLSHGYEAVANTNIPDNYYAVFGTSPNSLDSRYSTIGLINVSDIDQVGFPIPFFNIKELEEWL